MGLLINPTVRVAVHQLPLIRPFVKGTKVSKKAIKAAIEAHPRLEFIIAATGQHCNLEELRKGGSYQVMIRYNNDRDAFFYPLGKGE